ncbi:MAG: hypothetical protein ACRC5H_01070 [Treponemataceae bacterium]
MKKKLFLLILAGLNIAVLFIFIQTSSKKISYHIKTDRQDIAQIFYMVNSDEGFTEEKNITLAIYPTEQFKKISFYIPRHGNVSKLRFDFGNKAGIYYIKDFRIQGLRTKIALTNTDFIEVFSDHNQIENIEIENDAIKITTNGNDGFLVSNSEIFNKKKIEEKSLVYLFDNKFLVLYLCVSFLILFIYIIKKKRISIEYCIYFSFLLIVSFFSFYQSGFKYFFLKLFFIVSMLISFVKIYRTIDLKKDFKYLLALLGLFIISILPFFTQGFLYTDDIWGFRSLSIGGFVGMRRPLAFIVADYGMLLNHDAFYIFRIFISIFYFLFVISFFEYMKKYFARNNVIASEKKGK